MTQAELRASTEEFVRRNVHPSTSENDITRAVEKIEKSFSFLCDLPPEDHSYDDLGPLRYVEPSFGAPGWCMCERIRFERSVT